MGHLRIIKKLLQLWPNPDELLNHKEGQNIVHAAAKYGKGFVVDYILGNPKFEKLINAKDKEGNTPLHLAASQLQSFALLFLTPEDVVDLDLELVNNDNLTAFDVADGQRKTIDAPRELLAVNILKAVKAPRSKDTAICGLKGLDPGRDVEPRQSNRLKDEANTCMVVAALVAAMTFAAGCFVPGGYNDSEPNAGIATLLNNPMYDVFVICNTVAMYSWIIAVVILLKKQPDGFRPGYYFLRKVRLPLLIALASMSMVIMAGVYVTVSKHTWVAVFHLIIGITALFHVSRSYSHLFLWTLFYYYLILTTHARRLPSCP